MQDIILHVHKFLLKNRKTVSVAESCTAGMASCLLTRFPGSSKYFILGVIAYSNRAKEKVVKIPRRIIVEKGAVSRQTALALAKNVRKIGKTDLGIGITGIAGPGGGTAAKPVGTVFIAINSPDQKLCEKFIFKGKRRQIQKKASLKALELLLKVE